ncbi:GNAT family N-acetyltransferase [Nocardioides sp.]|uniref:GNAT family N-acetyltransferase n=1 Tax=Nocardioides sp. TaxID=35761 RepID=UPI0035636504
MDQWQLRPAVPADAARIAEIHLSARRAAPMPEPVHSEDEVRAWLETRLRSDDEVWVAEIEGAVIGYARMTATWLDDLYVDPARTGQGVGSALLDLVQALRPDGFSLWVFASNRPARSFYAARGLVELEHTDGSANEERSPDVRMAWPGADPLRFFRSLIDEVDDQLGDLLARRAALTRAVQSHKHDTARDPVRERRIAEAMAVRAPELGVERLSRIVDAIITESLDAAAEER